MRKGELEKSYCDLFMTYYVTCRELHVSPFSLASEVHVCIGFRCQDFCSRGRSGRLIGLQSIYWMGRTAAFMSFQVTTKVSGNVVTFLQCMGSATIALLQTSTTVSMLGDVVSPQVADHCFIVAWHIMTASGSWVHSAPFRKTCV